LKLTRFRVKDFRAVQDTGWIECQKVTAFAGENEAGKTTLFMALLKLTNFAKKDGETGVFKSNETRMARIRVSVDMPIDRKAELESVIHDTTFIYAEFELNEPMQAMLRQMLPWFKEDRLVLSRKYSGEYNIDILEGYDPESVKMAKEYIIDSIPKFMYYKEVFEIGSKIDFIALALKLNRSKRSRNLSVRETIVSNLLDSLDIWEKNLIRTIAQVYENVSVETKDEVDFRQIFDKLPLFKARVERGFEKLNREFLKWWGKDDVTVTFEPYQKGIMIVVKDADGKSYLLENRSTGFRRFFSLFLSFSISERAEYENAILLFDEAGAALHSVTQKKLADFFNNLGQNRNAQILYNTHTSYMLQVSHMNRVRVVYKDACGHVQISDTLKVNKDRSNEMSLFPVQSALALYIAEKAMAGCWPIVVLNDWDEHYLSLIRNILSANGRLRSVYTTLVFATGENGIDATSEAFSDGEDYPVILLPSDPVAKKIKARLLNGKYKNFPGKVLELSDFISDAVKFEDLIPGNIVEIFSRVYLQNTLGAGFTYNKEEGLIEQVNSYATQNSIELPIDFRTQIAKRMKLNTMAYFKDVRIKGSRMNEWHRIWDALLKER